MSHLLAALGDYYHCSDLLVDAVRAIDLPAGMERTIVRYPDEVSPQSLVGHDVLLLAMMGQLDPRENDDYWFDAASQAVLSDHVASGAGVVFLHSGTASHPTDGPLRSLCGGHFLRHPPEHPEVTISAVADHPITSHVSTFAHPDEHYFMEVDDGVTPLLTASSTLGEQSAGWCREHGKGRVAVIIPGHTREMLSDPNLRRLLSNAVAWVNPKRQA